MYLIKIVESIDQPNHQHGDQSRDKKIGEGGTMMGRAAPFLLAGHDSTRGVAGGHYRVQLGNVIANLNGGLNYSLFLVIF